MLTWLDIPDLPDVQNEPFDIEGHHDEILRQSLGHELYEWLGRKAKYGNADSVA